MSLVLAFGVQGIVDALSLTRVSDQYQSKRLGSPFEITFSVGLTSDTIAYDTESKRVSDHNDLSTLSGTVGRIDSSGYRVYYATNGSAYRHSAAATALSGDLFVDPRPSYKYVSGNSGTLSSGATESGGTENRGASNSDSSLIGTTDLYVNTSGQVVDATGKLVYTRTGAGTRYDNNDTKDNTADDTADDPYEYTLVEKKRPDTPIAETDRFDFNEESVSIALTRNGSADATTPIIDMRDGEPARSMIETNHFAQLRNQVTLECKPTQVGTYVITIVDNTIADDFRAGQVPTNRQSLTFTLYVAELSPTLNPNTNTITATTTRVDTGVAKEPVSSRFTIQPTDGDVQVRYRVVGGNGTLYVGNEELTQGNPISDLTVHEDAEVWINMNKTTNKITATLQGGDPNVNSFQASIVFEYTGTDKQTSTTPTTTPTTPTTPTTGNLNVSVSGTGGTRTVTVTAQNPGGTPASGISVLLNVTNGATLSRTSGGTPLTSTLTLPVSTAGNYTLTATTTAGYAADTETINVTLPGNLGLALIGEQVNGSQTIQVTARNAAGSFETSPVLVTLSGAGISRTVTVTGSQNVPLVLPTASGTLTARATGYNPGSVTLPARSTTPTTPTTPTTGGVADSIVIDGSRTLDGTLAQATRLRARVLDANDRGVSEVAVTFRVLSPGRGTFAGARGSGRAIRLETDRNGYATVNFTPTTEGDVIVEAKAGGVSAAVTFILDVGEATADAGRDTGTSDSQESCIILDYVVIQGALRSSTGRRYEVGDSIPRPSGINFGGSRLVISSTLTLNNVTYTCVPPTPTDTSRPPSTTTINPVVKVKAANRPPMLWVDGGGNLCPRR